MSSSLVGRSRSGFDLAHLVMTEAISAADGS
jgi:hypothetical protein